MNNQNNETKWLDFTKNEEINQATKEQVKNILEIYGKSVDLARIQEYVTGYEIYLNERDVSNTEIKLMQRLGHIRSIRHNLNVDRHGITKNTILFSISKVFNDPRDDSDITPIVHDKKELIIGPTQ